MVDTGVGVLGRGGRDRSRSQWLQGSAGRPHLPSTSAPPPQHISPSPHTLPWQLSGGRQCSLKTHFAAWRAEARWLRLSSAGRREPLKGFEQENGVFRSRLQRLHQKEGAEGPRGCEKWQSLGAGAGGVRRGRGGYQDHCSGGWPSKLGPPAAHGAASAPGPRAGDSPAWEGLQGRVETPHWCVPETTSQRLPSCRCCQGSHCGNAQTGCGREVGAVGAEGRCGDTRLCAARRAQVRPAGWSWRAEAKELRLRCERWAPASSPLGPPTSSAGESLKDPFHRRENRFRVKPQRG